MRLTDEQLQELCDAKKSFAMRQSDMRDMAAELIEARREIGELKDAIEFTVALRRDSVARLCDESAQKASALMKIAALEAERDELRTEVERLRKELDDANDGCDDRLARHVKIWRKQTKNALPGAQSVDPTTGIVYTTDVSNTLAGKG